MRVPRPRASGPGGTAAALSGFPSARAITVLFIGALTPRRRNVTARRPTSVLSRCLRHVNQLAIVYVTAALVSALLVLADIFPLRRRQPMAIMEAVWPLTMLYWGPLGLMPYYWFGRGAGANKGHDQSAEPPMWQAFFKGATHCGAGRALGDFVGDWLAVALGLRLLGSELAGKFLLAFVLAYVLGILFQYFSIALMRGLGLRDGLLASVKADTLSLLAYEVGMFAWMGARTWLYPHLQPTDWSYWLMIQVAMLCGFATTYPVNWWLIRNGTKKKMQSADECGLPGGAGLWPCRVNRAGQRIHRAKTQKEQQPQQSRKSEATRRRDTVLYTHEHQADHSDHGQCGQQEQWPQRAVEMDETATDLGDGQQQQGEPGEQSVVMAGAHEPRPTR